VDSTGEALGERLSEQLCLQMSGLQGLFAACGAPFSSADSTASNQSWETPSLQHNTLPDSMIVRN